MDEVLTVADFQPHIGKSLTPRGQHRLLTLVSIDEPKLPPSGFPGRAPFTLLFSGPPGDVLPEGLYDVVVEDGAEFTIYIIPIQTFRRDRQDYQAVFN